MESKMRKNSCKNAILICLSSGCAFRLFFFDKKFSVKGVVMLSFFCEKDDFQ